ncbi:MAG: sugar phosphate isomerase/epimerase family protein [Planctomycetota bacterium]
MRLGYNTSGLQNHRLDDALRLLADVGYGAVAITPDIMHLDPFAVTAREVDRVAGLLDELDLDPVIETGARFVLDPRHKHEPTLMTRSNEGRRRRLDFYRRCCELGRDLGAGVLSFWAGVDRRPGPDSTAWLRDGIQRTCELARAKQMVPALEPEPGMAVATVADYERLAAALGSDAPRLCLDVGHLYVIDEGAPADLIARVGPRLAQVHLEDIRRGVHEHLPPGEGDVDFSAIGRALQQSKYRGPVCWELSRSSHAAASAVSVCREVWQAAVR